MSLRDPDAPSKSNDHDQRERRERRQHRARRDGAKLARREQKRNAPDEERHYAAMARVLVAALPSRAPGVTLGSVLEAARRSTSRRQFPGDTHRMWARKVLDDLVTNGTVAASEGGGLYLKGHRAA